MQTCMVYGPSAGRVTRPRGWAALNIECACIWARTACCSCCMLRKCSCHDKTTRNTPYHAHCHFVLSFLVKPSGDVWLVGRSTFFRASVQGWASMMAQQTTLFGNVVPKDRFFKGLPASDGSSQYYSTIEALWTLEKSSDREGFFKDAQRQWNEVFSKDPQARAELLRRANTSRAGHTTRRLASSFVILSEEEAAARSSSSSITC